VKLHQHQAAVANQAVFSAAYHRGVADAVQVLLQVIVVATRHQHQLKAVVAAALLQVDTNSETVWSRAAIVAADHHVMVVVEVGVEIGVD